MISVWCALPNVEAAMENRAEYLARVELENKERHQTVIQMESWIEQEIQEVHRRLGKVKLHRGVVREVWFEVLDCDFCGLDISGESHVDLALDP